MHCSLNSCCLSGPSHCHLSSGLLQEGSNQSPCFALCPAHLWYFPQRAVREKLLNIIRSWHSFDSVLSLAPQRKRNSIMAPSHHCTVLCFPPSPLSLGYSHTGILSAPPVPFFSSTRPEELQFSLLGRLSSCFPAELTTYHYPRKGHP